MSLLRACGRPVGKGKMTTDVGAKFNWDLLLTSRDESSWCVRLRDGRVVHDQFV